MDLASLIRKYNVQGPRYTSYPTALQFREATERQVRSIEEYLRERNERPRRVSLYVHVPFCFSLCWYCGCTKVITRDRDRGDLYLDYLEREMDRIAPLMHERSELVQVHFGGGTPTFLKPEQLLRLGEGIRSRFPLTERTEFGVEIDPRSCSREHVSALKAIGVNRASLGVQDTNPEVQQAIHRIQPFRQTRDLTGWLREAGIDSINFDLIYGLPRQRTETFSRTLDDVLQLEPDRLAVYSFAHIPSIMPSQKLLKAEELPSTDEKLSMLQLGIAHLTANGYRFIGMDHFSREDEELTRAFDEGTLQRNFQGYSTHSGADLYAFGMSGISNVGDYYWQNTKDLEVYYSVLDSAALPATKFLQLCKDDKVRNDAIMQLMCKRTLSFQAMERKWGIVFEEYFKESLERLSEMVSDGLVAIPSGEIRITERGRLFLRNIAMCFDRYFYEAKTGTSYSKTV